LSGQRIDTQPVRGSAHMLRTFPRCDTVPCPPCGWRARAVSV